MTEARVGFLDYAVAVEGKVSAKASNIKVSYIYHGRYEVEICGVFQERTAEFVREFWSKPQDIYIDLHLGGRFYVSNAKAVSITFSLKQEEMVMYSLGLFGDKCDRFDGELKPKEIPGVSCNFGSPVRWQPYWLDGKNINEALEIPQEIVDAFPQCGGPRCRGQEFTIKILPTDSPEVLTGLIQGVF